MKQPVWLAFALAVVIGLGAYGLTRASFAQDIAKDDMRYEVNASVGKLVEAANRADVATVMESISDKPEVSVIADGEVYQGTSDIRAHAARLLGQRGKYVLSLGPMQVASVRGLAVATAPYTLRAGGTETTVARGAVTFLMERGAHRRWRVVHMHRSTTPSKTLLD